MDTSKYQIQPLPVGHRIGAFDVQSVIGDGGFGITYKAIDRFLGREVAIKEYFPSELARRESDGSTVSWRSAEVAVAYREGLDAFINEARTLAKFRHPSIVGVSQLRTGSNTAYIVMDYERGETLMSVARVRGRLSSLRINQIAHDLLSGLSEVHAQAVTHGDITPRNIILRPDGSAVLIDFGAAQSSWDAGIKPDAAAVYTPSYAAPEVRSGNGDLGPWTDFYSLGAVLFRCMTGTSPPSAESRSNEAAATGKGASASVDQVLNVDQALDALLPDWSATLVETARWMLQLSIEHRPRKAHHVLEALSLPAGESVNQLAGALGVKSGARPKSRLVRRRRRRSPQSTEKAASPAAISADVLHLFKRRVERLCPEAAGFVCQTAQQKLDEEQMLNCLVGMREDSTRCDRLIAAAHSHAAQTVSESDSRSVIETCLELLVEAGRLAEQ